MIFNEHVAPGELVVHVTCHVNFDMSVNHVSFPLREFQSPALSHPFKKMWLGASPKAWQRSSPQLQKVCASGQREEFKSFVNSVTSSLAHIRIGLPDL